jgi:integrase
MERDVTTEELAGKVSEFLLERKTKNNNAMNWSLKIFRDAVIENGSHPTREDVFDIVDGLKERYKPSSVNYIANSIKGFFNWMEDRGYTDGNIINKFPADMIRIPEKEVVTFSDVEYRRLLEASKGTSWNHLIKLGWSTGMRISDCAKLEWKSVKMEEKTIFVEPSKTSEFDTRIQIPMTDELYEMLEEMEGSSGGGRFVLPRLAAVAMVGNGNISSHFNYWLTKVGLYEKGKTFHAFRRTAISRWLSHPNADIVTVRHLSGHKSIKSLLRYIKPSMDKKKLIMGIE